MSYLFFLSHKIVFKFSGPNPKEFIQGCSSNDIKLFQSDHPFPTFFLSEKGKWVAAVKIFQRDGSFLGITSKKEFDLLKSSLRPQLLLSDMDLEDLSGFYQVFLVTGEGSENRIKELSDLHFLQADSSFIFKEKDWIFPAWTLIVPIEKKMKEEEWNVSGDSTSSLFNFFRIQSGFPEFGIDVNEKTLPPEVGWEHYISYTKGCYKGQETISRIKHYGKVNKKLIRLSIDSDLAILKERELLSDTGQRVGVITSSELSPDRSMHIGLGFAQAAYAEKGMKLFFEVEGFQPVSVEVL